METFNQRELKATENGIVFYCEDCKLKNIWPLQRHEDGYDEYSISRQHQLIILSVEILIFYEHSDGRDKVKWNTTTKNERTAPSTAVTTD